MLEDKGAKVDIANNVAEAFALLARVEPDLAILDVNVGVQMTYVFAAHLLELEIPFNFSCSRAGMHFLQNHQEDHVR